MAKSCTTGPEWDALKTEIGESNAVTVVAMYHDNGNQDLPTMEEAKILLKQITVLNKDEQLSLQSNVPESNPKL